MAATKWKCTKCGKIASNNGSKPYDGGCKNSTEKHNWVKDTFK
jgi:hypothetical protein